MSPVDSLLAADLTQNITFTLKSVLRLAVAHDDTFEPTFIG